MTENFNKVFIDTAPFLRTPDALQLATAIHHNCNKFLTNDKKLKQISEIKVILITDA